MKNLFLILYFAFFIFHSSPLLHARVLFGIDVLQKEKFQTLKGAKVGLITNHTGVDHRGRRTVDILDKTPHVELVAILSPEHGFSGTIEHGQTIEDGKESVTHIPIYSLYGQTTRPTEEMLSGIDTLVFDIQDVGTRFYTYIATMGKALEEAARKNIPFSVRISKTKLTIAQNTMDTILALLLGTVVNSPNRNTPKRDPNVTPPILNAHHKNPDKLLKEYAKNPRTTPNTTTVTRDTQR